LEASALAKNEPATGRIYLDNAATSWPKPESVYAAVDDYQRRLGTAAGRGVYAEAAEVDHRLGQARQMLASLIDAESWDRIVFAYSGTDSLHLALHGLLRPGDHVITSVCDHNAVLRPLRDAESRERCTVTRLPCDSHGVLDPASVRDALRDNTRVVVLVHASNVTGAVQPLDEIGEILRQHPAKFVVDAAQTVGHLPVSVSGLNCDVLAAPCHKGLMAPTGTGFLYLRPGLEQELLPVRLGGTGTQSESDEPPRDCPTAYEAGNANVPGLIGLHAGLEYLREHGVARIAAHEAELTEMLWLGLAALAEIQLFGPPPRAGQPRAGVVSFQVRGYDPQEVAVLLDQAAQIQVRSGFHCAPLMHRALQTETTGGTVRVSCGAFTTAVEIEALLGVLRSLLS
jgi:cysteine desulfurase family protein